MDVLSEILDKVELTSSYWYRTSFAGDWGISLPQEENLSEISHRDPWRVLVRGAKNLNLRLWRSKAIF